MRGTYRDESGQTSPNAVSGDSALPPLVRFADKPSKWFCKRAGGAEVVAVGDTPLDLQAGSNAGLPAVLSVLSGASTAEKLHAQRGPTPGLTPKLLPSGQKRIRSAGWRMI